MAVRDSGGQLLQELEALSQALYKSPALQLQQQEPRRDFEGKILPSRRRASEAAITTRKEQQVSTDSRHSISAPNPGARAEFDRDESESDENQQNFDALLRQPGKKSFWDWKPLRALAHIGQQRFHCEFTAHVHGIEKLPAFMNGLRLQVHLRQNRDAGVHTMPSRASHGSAEFEETMQFRCNVYGSKKSNGTTKYMSKSFDLYVVAMDVAELDLGKQKLDLSRILPSTAVTPVDGSNTWNTSFKLSGKAKGALLWVTFSYEILDGNGNGKGGGKYGQSPSMRSGGGAKLRSFNSLPSSPQVRMPGKKSAADFGSPTVSEPGNDFHVEHLNLDEDVKPASVKAAAAAAADAGGDLPKPKPSGGAFESRGRSLFPEIDAGVVSASPSRALSLKKESFDDEGEFGVIDQGVEVEAELEEPEPEVEPEPEPENVVVVENLNFVEDEPEDDPEVYEEARDEERQDEYEHEWKDVEDDAWNDDPLKVALEYEADELKAALEYEPDEPIPERSTEPIALRTYDSSDDGYAATGVLKTYESSDEADLVAGEFLGMLDGPSQNVDSSDSEPDSPRAKLLKQFEQEAGSFGLDVDDGSSQVPEFNLDDEEEQAEAEGKQAEAEAEVDGWDSDEDQELAEIMDAAEAELQKATQAMKSKARAKMLEDAEAEALLQEWGLNEKAFRESPPPFLGSPESDVGGSNSLVVRELSPLAPGVGAVVPTSDGGSLRSMNSALFQGASNDGKLVMHVSKPVVVPVEMGSSAVDVLRNMASAGTENMTVEAMQAMPLEDITGKSVQQISMEGEACFQQNQQRYTAAALEYGSATSGELVTRNSTSGLVSSRQSKYERRNPQSRSSDLVSLDELAPVAMEKIESLAMQGLKIQCEMADEEAPYSIEAAHPGGMKMLEGPSGGATQDAATDGMMAMSLSLDEWMKLDAGMYDEADTNDKTMAVLAAHGAAHGTTTDIILNLGGDEEGEKKGKLGNTLTLAMLVQLRDPLRNFEPVGAPMMALVEAERVMVPPRPRLYKRVAIKGNTETEDDERSDNEEELELPQPQFKITGVHMAGLKPGGEETSSSSNSRKKPAWGNAKQQQSGSRWLVASGMGKPGATSKHPLLKNPGSAAGSSSDSLWSISSRLTEERRQVGGANSGSSRNPDVKFGSRIAAAFGRRR